VQQAENTAVCQLMKHEKDNSKFPQVRCWAVESGGRHHDVLRLKSRVVWFGRCCPTPETHHLAQTERTEQRPRGQWVLALAAQRQQQQQQLLIVTTTYTTITTTLQW